MPRIVSGGEIESPATKLAGIATGTRRRERQATAGAALGRAIWVRGTHSAWRTEAVTESVENRKSSPLVRWRVEARRGAGREERSMTVRMRFRSERQFGTSSVQRV